MASSSDHPDGFNIVIRSIHIKTTQINVKGTWTVSQLKSKLEELEGIKDKMLRIIYHGKNLADSQLLSDAGIREGSNVHVSVTTKPKSNNRDARRLPARQEQRIQVENQDSSDSESDSDEPLRGFDRLREMGFSQEDINQFRLQFYISHLRHLPADRTHPAPQASELLQLEDQWIDSQFNPQQQQQLRQQQNAPQERSPLGGIEQGLGNIQISSFDEGQDGTYFNLLIGLILGFVMGLIMLFWVSDPGMARKTRFGIVAGIVTNIIFGLIHFSR